MDIKPYLAYQEAEILPLYQAVGWSSYYRRPRMLRQAFAGSLCTLAAYDGGKLTGIIRAVGDGHSILFIQDILVHPGYQRRGIGTALMKELLDRFPHVYQIQLSTDDTEKTSLFYKSLGFMPLPEIGCRGFMKQGTY